MFRMGRFERMILREISEKGAIISVVVDPMDYPSLDKAVEAGINAWEGGADIIAVGGSMQAQGEVLDFVTKRIKEETSAPLILFPGNIATLSKHADAIYFMSLLNSRNPYWISQAQTLAAPVIRSLGIEPLPVGYIVVEPGGTVGWVGDANTVPRNKPHIAAALALAGQYGGCRFIFTDAGSASRMGPVPISMIKAIRDAIDVTYIVAGGIRTPVQAKRIVSAGADWVQIGTSVERTPDVRRTVRAMVKAVREGRK